jgi:hypothetical protein
MKKILLFSLALFVVAIISAYIFIPSKIMVSISTSAAATPGNVVQALHSDQSWKMWWPSSNPGQHKENVIEDDVYGYHTITPLSNGANMIVSMDDEAYRSGIIVVPMGRDSTYIQWNTDLETGLNPVKRVALFFEYRGLKEELERGLQNLKAFVEKTENIYGFTIERTTFTDTILMGARFLTQEYPGTTTIYKAIDSLRQKIADVGAREKDYPMLNVHQVDSNQYQVMIAICIDRLFDVNGRFFISRMVPMKDRFLKTEVTGGPVTLKKAHEAINRYMNDRILTAPAIPFEILVTDRRLEKDSSKWKTIIYHPSM